jgi:hypothetical protein
VGVHHRQVTIPPASELRNFGESLAGGYDADDTEDPARKDALGFNQGVQMLCSVLADKAARPPMSVGLFAEWEAARAFSCD